MLYASLNYKKCTIDAVFEIVERIFMDFIVVMKLSNKAEEFISFLR